MPDGRVPDPTGDRRLPELDSLRGLAALTVVLQHFYDTWRPNDPGQIRPIPKLLLHLAKPFYSGSESVVLFFVLSGLVLSLPYLRGKQQAYSTFLKRRVIRIYGPYLAALVLAIAGDALWHYHPDQNNWSAPHWAAPITLPLILQHVAFLGVYHWEQFDFVIWSLILEMRVSIVFPAVFYLVAKLRILGTTILCVLLVLSGWVIHSRDPLSAASSLLATFHCIVFFAVGILVAGRISAAGPWWSRLSRSNRYLIGVCSLVAFSYGNLIANRLLHVSFQGDLSVGKTVAQELLQSLFILAGVLGFLFISLGSGRAKRLLTKRPARFLGRISYSLYLIHPIVLMALTFGCRGRVGMWTQFLVYVVAAPLVSWAFCVSVEERCIALSRRVRGG